MKPYENPAKNVTETQSEQMLLREIIAAKLQRVKKKMKQRRHGTHNKSEGHAYSHRYGNNSKSRGETNR